MNDLFELNFHLNEQELAHENGPEEGEGPTAPTQDAFANPAKWRQISLVSGGLAVHRFCHVGAIYKGEDIVYSRICYFLRSEINHIFLQSKDLCMFLEVTMEAADSTTS